MFTQDMLRKTTSQLRDTSFAKLANGEGGKYHLKIVALKLTESQLKTGQNQICTFEILSGKDRLTVEGNTTLIPTEYVGEKVSWVLPPEADKTKNQMNANTTVGLLLAALGLDQQATADEVKVAKARNDALDLYNRAFEEGAMDGFEVKVETQWVPTKSGQKRLDMQFRVVKDEDLVNQTTAESRRYE